MAERPSVSKDLSNLEFSPLSIVDELDELPEELSKKVSGIEFSPLSVIGEPSGLPVTLSDGSIAYVLEPDSKTWVRENVPIIGGALEYSAKIIDRFARSAAHGFLGGAHQFYSRLKDVIDRANDDLDAQSTKELEALEKGEHPWYGGKSKTGKELGKAFISNNAEVRRKILKGMSDFLGELEIDARAGQIAIGPPRVFGDKFVSALTRAGVDVLTIVGLSRLFVSPSNTANLKLAETMAKSVPEAKTAVKYLLSREAAKNNTGVILAMATLGAADAYAARQDTLGVSRGAVSGALLGGIFVGTGYLPKVLSLPTNALIFGGMHAQQLAAMRGGLENLTPEDKQDILVEALVGVLLDAALSRGQPSMEEFLNTIRNKKIPEVYADEALRRYQEYIGTKEGRADLEAKLNELLRDKEEKVSPDQLPAIRVEQPAAVRTERLLDVRTEQPPIVRTERPPEVITHEGVSVPDEQLYAIRTKQLPDTVTKLLPEDRTEPIPGDIIKLLPSPEVSLLPDDIARLLPGDVARLLPHIRTEQPAEVKPEQPAGRPRQLHLRLGKMERVKVERERVRSFEEISDELKIFEDDMKRQLVLEFDGLTKDAEFAETVSSPKIKEEVLKSVDRETEKLNSDLAESVKGRKKKERYVEKVTIEGLPKRKKKKELQLSEETIREIEEETAREVEKKLKEEESHKVVLEERSPKVIEEDIAKTRESLRIAEERLKSALTKKGEPRPGEEGVVESTKKLIDFHKRKLSALEEELLAARISEFEKIMGEDVHKPEGEMMRELDDFELPEEARAVIDADEPAFKVVSKAEAISKQKTAFQDVRKGMKPAYMFRASKKVITGESHEAMTDEVLYGGHDTSLGVEMGWIDPETGTFISESSFRSGPIDNIKLVDKESTKSIARAISILKNQTGGVRLFDETPQWIEVPDEVREQVARIRDMFPALLKKAKEANMSVEDFLYKNGFSEENIDLIKKISRLEVRTEEATKEAKATDFHKREVHRLAKKLGVNHREVAETLGISKDKSMKDYTYEEGEKLYQRLKMESGEPITEEVLKETLDKEPGIGYADLYTQNPNMLKRASEKIKSGARHIISPDLVLRDSNIYKMLDRADVLMRKHLEYIMSDVGLKIDSVLRLIRPGTESSRNIAKGLEGKVKLSELKPEEAEAVRLLRNFYNHALDFTIKRLVPDEDMRKKVQEIAEELKFRPDENKKEIDAILKARKEEFGLTDDAVKAINILRMRIDNYMTHVIDKKYLTYITKNKMKHLAERGMSNTPQYKELAEFLSRLTGGELYNYRTIPKEIAFAYFKERYGSPHYIEDAGVAFTTYVKSWLRETYINSILPKLREEYLALDDNLKPYARKYIYDFLGWGEKTPVADAIKSFEWIRTLGFAGVSAFTNATQILNTAADAGIYHSFRGLVRSFKPGAVAQFKATGLHREIPQVMHYTTTDYLLANTLEKIRAVAGFLFNTVEFGVRMHAYHTYMSKGAAKGLRGDDLFWYAVDGVHRTQFKYGSVGMPLAMRGWLGVATQFSSYPVKQLELLYKWWKGGPEGKARLAMYVAMVFGVKYAAEELLEADLSSALGPGVKFAHVVEMLDRMTAGDWERVRKEWELAFAEGRGLLPQSFPLLTGPFLSTISALTSHSEDKWAKVFASLEPIQAFRFRDFYNGIKYREGGRYPIFQYTSPEIFTSDIKAKKYELNLRDLVARTFFYRPAAETRYHVEELYQRLTDKQVLKVLQRFDRAIYKGDHEEIQRLFNHYPYIVQGRRREHLRNEILNMVLTKEERRLLQESEMVKRRKALIRAVEEWEE